MTARTVTYHDKSFPAELVGRPIDRLDAPLSSFSTPLFVLDRTALDHNIALFASWVAERGLELMPHGKTTMAPALWRAQLDAGASGITVATGWQADVALRAGVPTVQIANECTDPRLLARLADRLRDHPEQRLVFWIDSEAALERLEAAAGTGARLDVLIELGSPGARAGVRDEDTALGLAERTARSDSVTLAGVAGYEGALAHDRSSESLIAVRAYCDRLVHLLDRVRPLVDGEPWITAGGSAYFEIVAASFATVSGARRILRSGAYVVHDSGFYHGISPLDEGGRTHEQNRLRAAMFAYARVLSLPEPGLALLDAGKRDLPFDEGLPIPLAAMADLGAAERPIEAEITATNDQHAYLRWRGDTPVAVGDVVRLGLSHPCTAFDKWRLVAVVESDGGHVSEAVETFF